MKKKGVDRREFLKLTSAGLAGGLLAIKGGKALAGMMSGGMGGGGGGMGGGGGGMGGGGSVIDPPPGAAFADPVSMPFSNPEPGVVEVNLQAKMSQININGTLANLWTYAPNPGKGSYPGPVIRVKQGDLLRLNFANNLPTLPNPNILGFTRNITNIHTHGWHVSPSEPMDNVMRKFLPGQSTLTAYGPYEYDTSMVAPGAMSFYHPHMHGLVAEQVWGGLAGPIVVEDDPNIPAYSALSKMETHLLVLKDISLNGTDPAPYTSSMEYMQGKEGNLVMVNGLVNPVLKAKPGQVQRWRILNASQARFYKLSLAGHSLQLIGTDGGLLNKPYAQSYILLAPGERVDVLIKAKSTGTYKLYSLPYSRMGMMTSAQITLMTLSVSGTSVNDSIPAAIDPKAVRLNVNDLIIAQEKTITLSMMHGRGYINGYDFDVQPYVGQSEMGTYEIWNIVNQSNMDHPWHQHTNEGQVLSISGGDAAYASLYTSIPARKDVVIVPKMGTIRLLMPVMDYDGMAMFHCHILEHEDIGMIAVWEIGMGNMGGM